MLGGYGTGAIMAVPAHDERDFAFARKFGLPIVKVVMPKDADPDAELESAFIEHTVDEVMVNSGRFTGRPGGGRPGTRSSAGWRSRARAGRRSPTGCATG